MKRAFIINLALLLFLNLLVKPFWIFGIDREVQNTVGAESYGTYAALFSLTMILNIFLDLGITNFNNRNIAQHNHLLRKYFSNIVVLKIMLGCLYTIIGVVIGISMGFTLYKWYLFGFLVFNQFLLSFILYLRSNISGLQFYRVDSIVSVTDRLLLIVLCGYLLLFHKSQFTIEIFVYTQTIAYFITALFAFVFVYKKAAFFRLHFDYKFLLVILKQSYPFALLALLMGLYTRIDMVMIESLLPENGALQAGIYAQSYRILDAISMFAYLFATLLLPMFSKMLKKNENIGQLAGLSTMLLVLPSIIFVITTMAFSKELMHLLYDKHFNESAEIYFILILGFIPIASTYIFGTLLTANNSLRALNITAFAGMCANIIINLIVIPKYGAKGAAISSVATQFFTGLAQVIICIRIFKFQIQIKQVLLFATFVCIQIAMCVYAKNIIPNNWIMSMVLLIVFGMGLAFAMRLINVKNIIKAIKQDA